jgi:CRP-like cAMP-binding protein
MTEAKGLYAENRLLAALPKEERQRLLPYLEFVPLSLGQVLHEAYQPIRHVYFPINSVISLISTLKDGTMVELGMIGVEGMVGISVLLETDKPFCQAMVQTGDGAVRLKVQRLRDELERGGKLRSLLLRYTNVFMAQLAETSVCHRLHNLKERFACWLLMVQDRMQRDELFLTHDFISQMLGVRRPVVTDTALSLQRAGLISYKRGHVKILNRRGLEEIACEHYQCVGYGKYLSEVAVKRPKQKERKIRSQAS